jgi:hypothetical protein
VPAFGEAPQLLGRDDPSQPGAVDQAGEGDGALQSFGQVVDVPVEPITTVILHDANVQRRRGTM